MRDYELTFIADPNLGEEGVQKVIDKYTETLKLHKSKVLDVKSPSKRRLAYEIKDRREGVYVTMKIEATPEAEADVRRLMGYDDDILRSICLVLEK